MGNKPGYGQLYSIAENQGGYFAASQAKETGAAWDRRSTILMGGCFSPGCQPISFTH